MPFDSEVDHRPSALWLWGLWIYVAAAVAALALAAYVPTPVDRILHGVAGVLVFIAGPHQLRVAKYKRASRGPYTIWGFDSYAVDRQTGWSAMVVGAFFIAGAAVGL